MGQRNVAEFVAAQLFHVAVDTETLREGDVLSGGIVDVAVVVPRNQFAPFCW